VPWIAVPTTLLGMVDAAIGGKTGIDLPAAKNYVGAFHPAEWVVADPGVLDTLPLREWAAGFAEVIKTGLLAGGRTWDLVTGWEPGRGTPERRLELIRRCAAFKANVVAEDPQEQGRRAVLNLGHTVGHAIEAATAYGRYRHGEAVGLGLLAALRLSGAGELSDEVAELLGMHGLPTRLDPAVDVDAVLEALERDKKRAGDAVGFVLLERPGEPITGRRLDPDSVRAAVEQLR